MTRKFDISLNAKLIKLVGDNTNQKRICLDVKYLSRTKKVYCTKWLFLGIKCGYVNTNAFLLFRLGIFLD